MGQLLQLLIPLVGLFLFIGLLWLVLAKLGVLKQRTGPAREGAGGSPLYKVRDAVLSPGEIVFLPALRDAVRLAWEGRGGIASDMPLVLASVRLAEVVEAAASRSKDRSAWQSAFNAIQSKQIDFVVCEAGTTRPLIAVELDDATHARANRRERDEAVEAICAGAGLPLLRVRAAASYPVQRLAAQINECLPTPRGGRR